MLYNKYFLLLLLPLLVQCLHYKHKETNAGKVSFKNAKKGKTQKVLKHHKGNNSLAGTAVSVNKNVGDVDGDITKRKFITGDRTWDSVMMAFRETIVRGFLQVDATNGLGSKLLIGHPIGIATVWLITILKDGAQSDSEWDKMEERLTRKIQASIDDNNIENLDDEWNRIYYLLGKAQHSEFTKADLNEIRAFAPNFFPQQYTAGKYTIKWPVVLTKYLTVLVAAYLDLMKQDVYDECEWAEQLKVLRPHIIQAARKLAKSRYQDLEKVSYNSVATFFVEASLTFKDKATGTTYSKIKLMDIKERVFAHLKDDTETFVMENLVNQFNDLFNDTWVPSSCNPPSKIEKTDLELKYPQKCMDKEGKCTFPCGYYTEDTKWCVAFKDNIVTENRWESTSGGGHVPENRILTHWFSGCEYPNWTTCMSTPRVPLIEWNEDDYNKKKKESKEE